MRAAPSRKQQQNTNNKTARAFRKSAAFQSPRAVHDRGRFMLPFLFRFAAAFLRTVSSLVRFTSERARFAERLRGNQGVVERVRKVSLPSLTLASLLVVCAQATADPGDIPAERRFYWDGNDAEPYFPDIGSAAASALAVRCGQLSRPVSCTLSGVLFETDSHIAWGGDTTYYLYAQNPNTGAFDVVSGPYIGAVSGGITVVCPPDYFLVYPYVVNPVCRPLLRKTIDLTQKGPAPDDCVGNPINPGIGNKREIAIDYVGTGAFPLAYSRTYNSNSKLGATWRGPYDRSISSLTTNGITSASVKRPEGQT
jgi:Domain of unknown function (DUF6531)